MCVFDFLVLVCYDVGNYVYRLIEMYSKEYLKEYVEVYMSSEYFLLVVWEVWYLIDMVILFMLDLLELINCYGY